MARTGIQRTRGTARNRREQSASKSLSPSFKLILWLAFSLTIASLTVGFCLAQWGRENEMMKELVSTCSTTWKIGFGAFIGLLGGKHLT